MANKRKLGHLKSLDSENKTLTALVSTNQWDRTGERFSKGAWDLVNYLKNAVVLWGHDPHSPPVAKTLAVTETDEGLMATMQFDQGSERAMEIFRLYKEGFLSAFSVGFIPKKWVVEPIAGTQEKGIVFTNAELLEYSAVSIPANPGALVSREQAEVMIKTLGAEFFKEVPGGASFMVTGPELPEEQPAVEPPPTPAPEPESPPILPTEEPVSTPEEPVADLEKSLRYLIDLAKTVKSGGLDKSKLALVQQAVSVLSEAVESNQDGVDAGSLKTLKEAVDAYAKALQELFPSNTVLLERVMKQIDKALEER